MIRMLVTLYHIAIALLAVGLLLALFIVVTYVLSDALLWYFFEIDMLEWVSDVSGLDISGFFGDLFGESEPSQEKELQFLSQ